MIDNKVAAEVVLRGDGWTIHVTWSITATVTQQLRLHAIATTAVSTIFVAATAPNTQTLQGQLTG